jgi:hypothetical protein
MQPVGGTIHGAIVAVGAASPPAHRWPRQELRQLRAALTSYTTNPRICPTIDRT